MILDAQFEVLPPVAKKRLVIEVSSEECDELIAWLVPVARSRNLTVPHAVALRVVEAMATQGVCMVCGCTDTRACAGGCTWLDDAHTICSSHPGFVEFT